MSNVPQPRVHLPNEVVSHECAPRSTVDLVGLRFRHRGDAGARSVADRDERAAHRARHQHVPPGRRQAARGGRDDDVVNLRRGNRRRAALAGNADGLGESRRTIYAAPGIDATRGIAAGSVRLRRAAVARDPRRASGRRRAGAHTPPALELRHHLAGRGKYRRQCWGPSELDQGRLQNSSVRGNQTGRHVQHRACPGSRSSGFSGSEVCRRIYAVHHRYERSEFVGRRCSSPDPISGNSIPEGGCRRCFSTTPMCLPTGMVFY